MNLIALNLKKRDKMFKTTYKIYGSMNMNKIIIDGKEYNLSDEFIEKIKEEIKSQDKPTFKRNKLGRYYFIGSDGIVSSQIDCNDLMTDVSKYTVANYCREQELMEQRALHETLNRLLWRYSEEHGGDTLWNRKNNHYFIVQSMLDNRFGTSYLWESKVQGCVYFGTQEAAETAIEEVVKPFMVKHPEFVW